MISHAMGQPERGNLAKPQDKGTTGLLKPSEILKYLGANHADILQMLTPIVSLATAVDKL